MTVRHTRLTILALSIAALVGTVGCTSASSSPVIAVSASPTVAAPSASPTSGTPTPSPSAYGTTVSQAKFEGVSDGDTIRTSAGKVRIIGIDTPETGQCGYDEASLLFMQLLSPGDTITLLLPKGQKDTDAYGRLLRFVETADGTDLGRLQIEAGNAVARYDSRDGYPAHPHEGEYRQLQTATLSDDKKVITAACAAAADALEAEEIAPVVEAPAVEAPVADNSVPWYMNYTSCTKLKKNTVGDPRGPFSRDDPADAEIYQWFAYGTGNKGDGDNDGLACE